MPAGKSGIFTAPQIGKATNEMISIAVIGAGSWGTTLAILLADKGYHVSLWVYENDLCTEMKKTGVNRLYLPGFAIPETVEITDDLAGAVHEAQHILTGLR